MPTTPFDELFKDDKAALRDFWDVYLKQQDAMREETLEAVRAHPHFGPLMKGMSKADMDRQNAESLELLRKGCVDGNWGPYLANLDVQGRMYAQMRIPFSSWYDLMRLVNRVLTPALVAAYASEPKRLARALGVMSAFFDAAMAAIGERYIEAKEDDRFRMLVGAIQDYAVFFLDPTGKVMTWNAGAEAMMGWAPGEIVGRTAAMFHPEEERTTGPEREIAIATAEGRFIDEGWRLKKDGTRFWASVVLTAIKDATGNLIGFAKVTRDLTERRRAEMALRASEQNLEMTLQSIGDGVIVTDNQGLVVRLNPVAEALTGWKCEDALGLPFSEVFRILNEVTGKPAVDPVVRVLREGVVVGLANHTALVSKDGGSRPIADSAAPIRDGSGALTGVVLVFRDMTREREAERAIRQLNDDLEQRVIERTDALRASEEQLRQSQKLESIGRLAGGIAHDFNNLLSVILSYGELMSGEIGEDDALHSELEEIRKAAQRAADLTRQLLAFSRQQVLAPKVTDLNQLITGMQGMFARLIGEHIEVRTRTTPELGPVMVDPTQLEQVIMNLVVNARDAMPEGGTLTLETANIDFDARYAAEHEGVAPGPHIMLAVTDSGMGMDKATCARIFEPFFTTKAQGKGTGLGLSTAHGIVKQSGGHIWVYSEEGRGTTFKIYFPRAEYKPKRTQPSMRSVPPVGTETILLVEDEDQVRALVRNVLRRQGYRVLDAENGQRALALVADEDTPIHLLLTDVVMPKMSGRELAEKVSKLRPTMRVLFMSGYTDDTIVHHGVLDAGVAFLQKPVTPDAITRKVREVLDAADGSRPSSNLLR